ncbi:MAG: ABC transporter substrate-binding protein [Nocardiopsaceae bacterium]|nr:ABC transporter substrate-binding protein [Nocardiopsaceae bacterium]
MRPHGRSWKIGLAIAGAAIVTAVSACAGSPAAMRAQSGGGGGSGGTVNFTLNYLPGGAQAGFMYGKSLGIFSKAGINLNIIPGSGSLTTAELVATGKSNLAYVDAPTAFSVAARGGKITVVAPILQVNGFALIALKGSGINSVKDLAGKRLGVIPGLAPTVLLPAVLSANGVSMSSVHQVNMQSSSQLGALLQHQVDAIVAAGDVQGPQLLERGQKLNQFFYYANGVPTVGESIVANTNYLKTHGALVKKFVQASLESWVKTRANPSAAAAAEAQQFPEEGTAAQELDQINVDLKLLCAAPGATHLTQIPSSVWAKNEALLKRFDNLPASTKIMDDVASGYTPSNLPAC